MRRNRWLAPVLGTLCMFGLNACSAESNDVTADASGAPEAQQRSPAPAFTLKDVEGRDVSLAQHRGQVVIVDFWATWCPPCIYQVPELNKLWVAHRDRGDLAVIGVAVDTEGFEVVAPWVQEQGVEYPIVVGDEALAREFGAHGFPTLAIIDREGNIDSLHVGLIEFEQLEQLVQEVPDAT